MSNVSRKDLEENCSDMTVEILNLSGKLRVAGIHITELENLNGRLIIDRNLRDKHIKELNAQIKNVEHQLICKHQDSLMSVIAECERQLPALGE